MFRRRCIRSACLAFEQNQHHLSSSLGAISLQTSQLPQPFNASFSVWSGEHEHEGSHQHNAHSSSSEGHHHSPHYHPSDHVQHTPRAARRPTSVDPSSPFTDTAVADFSERKPTRLTLKTLLHFGKQIDDTKIMASARYLHKELPIRLAHRIADMNKLPYIVGCNPFIKRVYDLYYSHFNQIRGYPPLKNMEEEKQFSQLIQKLSDEHRNVLELLGSGVREARKYMPEYQLQVFLDKMITSRISRRFLIAHHLCMSLNDSIEGQIGIISTNLSVRDAVQACTEQAKEICRENFAMAPEVVINGLADVKFSYIRYHLEFVLLELLKNSMRAVVETAITKHHGRYLDESALPPVVVTLCEGDQDITVRIADQGGGIPYSQIQNVWKYSFTTVDKSKQEQRSLNSFGMDHSQDTQKGGSPMAGLGFGLPLARLYATYFGGSLHLYSMHGYGTDVYLRLSKIGDQLENLEI